MIKFILIVAVIIVAVLFWWTRRPIVLSLDKNGWYKVGLEGLDSQQPSIGFVMQTKAIGTVLHFIGKNTQDSLKMSFYVSLDGFLAVRRELTIPDRVFVDVINNVGHCCGKGFMKHRHVGFLKHRLQVGVLAEQNVKKRNDNVIEHRL